MEPERSIGSPRVGGRSVGARPAALTVLLLALAPAPAPGQEPRDLFQESLEVRLIDIDVVVVDHRGDPVTGLGRDDFELRVDGEPVAITHFVAYGESGASVDPESPPPSTPEIPAAMEPESAPARVWAVLIDAEGISPPAKGLLTKEISAFLSKSVRSEDRSLVALFDGFSLRVPAPLAPGSAPAIAALDEIQHIPFDPNPATAEIANLEHQIRKAQLYSLPRGEVGDQLEEMLQEINWFSEAQAAREGRRLDALRDLLGWLNGLDARVGLLLVGNGFDGQPGQELFDLAKALAESLGTAYPSDPRAHPELSPRWIDLGKRADETLKSANVGRVTIFTIHVPSRRSPGTDASTPSAIAELGLRNEPTDMRVAAALGAFADVTGGRRLTAGANLGERLETARRDLDSYYSIGFSPTSSAEVDRSRFEVVVRRSGARALHRQSWTHRSREEAAAAVNLAALLGEESSPVDRTNGLVLEAGAIDRSGARNRAATVPVKIRIPIEQVLLAPTANGFRGSLLVLLALRNPDGGVRRIAAHPLDIEVAPEELESARQAVYPFTFDLRLAPGLQRLAVTVLDLGSGGTSTAVLALDVPKK